MNTSIEQRILACEMENARLQRLVRSQNLVWIFALLFVAGAAVAGAAVATAELKDETFGSITARDVTVVDGKGIVRARLGGDLPDAVLADGTVLNRGSKAAGLIIYDEQGIERGGYVTQDTGSNAMITLDSKYKQAVLLVAGPDKEPASALKLWTQDSSIELRSDSDGSRISANDGQLITFQEPTIAALPSATCDYLKELAKQYPGQKICQSRFKESTCSACLNNE